MDKWIQKYLMADDCCSGECNCHEHAHDEADEDWEEVSLQFEDPESGEIFNFLLADVFEHDGTEYAVLVPDEEAEEFYIARMGVDEDDEPYIETLEEDEADAIYDAYENFLDEYFESSEEGEDDEE